MIVCEKTCEIDKTPLNEVFQACQYLQLYPKIGKNEKKRTRNTKPNLLDRKHEIL